MAVKVLQRLAPLHTDKISSSKSLSAASLASLRLKSNTSANVMQRWTIFLPYKIISENKLHSYFWRQKEKSRITSSRAPRREVVPSTIIVRSLGDFYVRHSSFAPFLIAMIFRNPGSRNKTDSSPLTCSKLPVQAPEQATEEENGESVDDN